MVACAPWGAAGEFAASRHGALTRSQAAERGISSRVVSRLLRDGVLDEPTPAFWWFGVLRPRGTRGCTSQHWLVTVLVPLASDLPPASATSTAMVPVRWNCFSRTADIPGSMT